MLNHLFDQSVDRSWTPSSAPKAADFAEEVRSEQEKPHCLDGVPVMSATVLGLEMLLHEPFIDLRKASELVLSDVGATMQILRLIGREYAFASERPSRMDDCIASLDAGCWFGALCMHRLTCDREHAGIMAVWKHCRLVAQYAQLVAESMEGISPEDAYLVGLLHEVGAISAALGGPKDDSGASTPGALSGMEGSLPLFVVAAMRSANDSCSSSAWRLILAAAHELADDQLTIV